MERNLNLNLESFNKEVRGSKDLILVDFWAEWCGPCKMLSPILEEIESENKYRVFKVDVDKNAELISEFKIRSVPTLIVFKDGQKIDQMIGYKSKEEILEKLDSLSNNI